MKSKLLCLLFILSLMVSPLTGNSNLQDPPQQRHIVIKNDNSQFIGIIIFQDAREVIIKTENLGEVAIPKHEIREIKEVSAEEFRQGVFLGEDLFATRYFLTTNGLPVKKGENYIQWNLFGPDFQFGIADNFGVGVMTSWFAFPVVATAKYSRQLSENTSLALGGLLGTGSWSQPDLGIVLPFVAITSGSRMNNITLSVGYGGVFYSTKTYVNYSDNPRKDRYREGRFLLSVAGMTKLNPSVSLVFDSFIMPAGSHIKRDLNGIGI
jgi:hypothetical protein